MSEMQIGTQAGPADQGFKIRHFGAVNWIGLWTLYKKEVMRFLNVAAQTVVAPAATAMLFLAIFTLALGQYRPDVNGVPYASFIAPGLIMAAILQNAFANTSASLIQSKINGNKVDWMMPPLSPTELTVAFAMGGATRGVICALSTGIPMALFVDLPVSHVWAILFYAAGASVILALVGMITGIWAEKFDHLATITNFVIAPLSLLSGTFYSVSILPGIWSEVSRWNPFFYFIDGFRYGFTGQAEGSLAVGMGLTVALIAALWTWAHIIFARGYWHKA